VSGRGHASAGFGEILAETRILIVCGSGGVGKTTVAAALAAMAAKQGRRVLALTIDPARRLADALGLARSGDEAVPVSLPRGSRGALWARMLDRETALDRLIGRHAPSPERRAEILHNRFYRHVSSTLVGAHEYVAMEELAHLAGQDDHDLLVLDTPPAARALHFLDAPRKIATVLEDPVFRAAVGSFASAGRVSRRGLGVAGLALRAFSRLLGSEMLRETLEFLVAFQEMFDGFKTRARDAARLLEAPGTGFVVVATPHRSSLDDAARLADELGRRDMRLLAAIVNRIHPDPGEPPGDTAELAERLMREGGGQFRSPRELRRLLFQLVENHRRFQGLARAEAALSGQFAERLGRPLFGMPRRTRPVTDVAGLLDLATGLQQR